MGGWDEMNLDDLIGHFSNPSFSGSGVGNQHE